MACTYDLSIRDRSRWRTAHRKPMEQLLQREGIERLSLGEGEERRGEETRSEVRDAIF